MSSIKNLCRVNKRFANICDRDFFLAIIRGDSRRLINTFKDVETTESPDDPVSGRVSISDTNVFHHNLWQYAESHVEVSVPGNNKHGLMDSYDDMITEAYIWFLNETLKSLYITFPAWPFTTWKKPVFPEIPNIHLYSVLLANDRYPNILQATSKIRFPGVDDLTRDSSPEIFGNPKKWGVPSTIVDESRLRLFEYPFPGGNGGALKGITFISDTAYLERVFIFENEQTIKDIFEEKDEDLVLTLFENPSESHLVRLPKNLWVPTDLRIIFFLGSANHEEIAQKMEFTFSLNLSSVYLEYEPRFGNIQSIRKVAIIFDKKKRPVGKIFLNVFFASKSWKLEEELILGPYVEWSQLVIYNVATHKHDELFVGLDERIDELKLESSSKSLVEEIKEVHSRVEEIKLGKSLAPFGNYEILSIDEKAIIYNEDEIIPICEHVHHKKDLITYLENKNPVNTDFRESDFCPECFKINR